ncbi:hypothetical protein [Vibrio ulleungensis]|uniref:Uncharacterized protein n=1 Tax=Vibrio ulleungensis TaxID=2807619 RepID=A0ABS2HJP8_9VIBR|nr:hypothetical protein [Vibrio ulleungensis]MBM7036742.1 hypothetical protein [Vibrio ulleungensis]
MEQAQSSEAMMADEKEGFDNILVSYHDSFSVYPEVKDTIQVGETYAMLKALNKHKGFGMPET